MERVQMPSWLRFAPFSLRLPIRRAALALALILAVSPVGADGPEGKSPRKPMLAAPNSELAMKAKRVWDRLLTKCGNSYYTPVIYEYQGVSFQTLQQTLSEADVLNGYQQYGAAQLIARVTRLRNLEHREWGAFKSVEYNVLSYDDIWPSPQRRSVVMEVRIWKKAGHWIVLAGREEIDVGSLSDNGLTCKAVSGIHSRSKPGSDPIEESLGKSYSLMRTASFIPLNADEVQRLREHDHQTERVHVLSAYDMFPGSNSQGVQTWDRMVKSAETITTGTVNPVLLNPELPALPLDDGFGYVGVFGAGDWVLVKFAADGRLGLLNWHGVFPQR